MFGLGSRPGSEGSGAFVPSCSRSHGACWVMARAGWPGWPGWPGWAGRWDSGRGTGQHVHILRSSQGSAYSAVQSRTLCKVWKPGFTSVPGYPANIPGATQSRGQALAAEASPFPEVSSLGASSCLQPFLPSLPEENRDSCSGSPAQSQSPRGHTPAVLQHPDLSLGVNCLVA